MLAHTKRGDGPESVLLLHGFLGSGRNLGALVRAWSAKEPTLRFVQADLLGHGRSPDLPPDADLHTMGEAALELADHLGLPAPLRVVGHSIGGRVALTMKDLAPERVGRVDVLDIAPGPTRGLPTTNVAQILLEAPDEADRREDFGAHFREAGLSGALTDWLLMNLERDDAGYRWRIDRQALVDFHERTGDADLWPLAARHASSLKVMIGGDSKYVGTDDVARYRSLSIPVRVVAGAGHFLHVDATEEVAAALAAVD